MQDSSPLKYQKISNSRVLLHPNPKGVIQFIGSFIFGSFPACAYKSLHHCLFDRGYSLILYKFPLNPTQFNHWEVSLDLLKEQYALQIEIAKILKSENTALDLIELYLQPVNYLWLGHSLGCKYITLLEVLSQDSLKKTPILQQCLAKHDRDSAQIIDRLKIIESERSITDEVMEQMSIEEKPNPQFFIRDQPSVLLAPEIGNTVRFFRSNWRISNPCTMPNKSQTECLISSSTELFNLTGIISFDADNIAEDDVTFLVEEIENKRDRSNSHQELSGGHFEPITSHSIESLAKQIDEFFDALRLRLEC